MRRIRAGAAGRGCRRAHLRLEVGGRVAQIDHLLINRLPDTWVLDSKHLAEDVSINDHGEWTGFSGGPPSTVQAPIRDEIVVVRRPARVEVVVA
jgi:hypothetical protein